METTSTTTSEVPPTPPKETNPPEDTVSKDVFERYKSDAFKHKARVKELEKELEDRKLKALKDSQNWEEIAKLKEQEAKDAQAERDRLKQAVIDKEKFSSLRTEALKSGINPASLPDLELLDFAEINIETTNQGKILVHGADKAIQNLKMLRPHWFQAKPVTINPNTPETLTSMSGNISVADLEKLQGEYKKNPNPTTEKAYREAITKFKNQK